MFRTSSDSSNKELSDFVQRMAYTAEVKEWDNRPHLARVRRYCYAIASGLEMTQQDIDIIALASQLHDVGKSQLPERLLGKTGQFDEVEWKIVEEHTILGARLLSGSSSPILQAGEIIALTHHERWDGSGYPRGLKGQEIPMTGRIVALADVFDALTTPRPYKEALDKFEGLKILQESSGKLFDPLLVKIFSGKFNEILRTRPL